MILVYGYGGGSYRRFAAKVSTREAALEAVNRALDQGHTIITITVETETKTLGVSA